MILSRGKNSFAGVLLLALLSIGISGYADTPAEFNRLAGLPFAGKDWSFASLSQRLHASRLRLQSSPGRHSAFLNGRKIFKEPCMELVIVTDSQNRTVSSIELIFANKGDIAHRAKSAIRQTERSLEMLLTAKFGKPEKERLGPDTKKYRRDVLVWYCHDTAILLEAERGEYVIIHLRPRQQIVQQQPEKLAVNISGNVKRNKFGDVFISNIPMVDQGGKGYCAVATVARVVMYFGIKDAGMHLLADAAKSDAEGGTSLASLNRALKPLRREFGIKQKYIGEVSIKLIKPYIDDGIPVLWTMYATPEYEAQRLSNTKKRIGASSPQEWAKTLRKTRAVRSSRKNPHICLIIGYNQETGEIAVSNSWGVRENIPTWVPEKSARKVCQRATFVILP